MSDDKGLALNLAYSNVSGKKWLKQKWTANYNNNNDTEEHKQRLSLILHEKKKQYTKIKTQKQSGSKALTIKFANKIYIRSIISKIRRYYDIYW